MDDITQAVIDRLEGKLGVRFYDQAQQIVYEGLARIIDGDKLECDVVADCNFTAYYTSVAPYDRGLAKMTVAFTVANGNVVTISGLHPLFPPQ